MVKLGGNALGGSPLDGSQAGQRLSSITEATIKPVKLYEVLSYKVPQ